jgi:hypothetical protein
MRKLSTGLLVGIAMTSLGATAWAQGAPIAGLSALPDMKPGSVSAPVPPALNPPAPPAQLAAPLSTGAGSGTQSTPPGAMAGSPVGPGSGHNLAFNVPPELSIAFSTAAIGKDRPSGSFSVASGPEPEHQADQDGVPPLLGVDVSSGSGAALAGRPVQSEVKLGNR